MNWLERTSPRAVESEAASAGRTMDDRLHLSKFIPQVLELCPGSFRAAGSVTEYGQKFHLSNGCVLVISWKADQLVSKFHSEYGVPPAEVVEAALALAEKYTLPGSRRRRELTERLIEWRSKISTGAPRSATNRHDEENFSADEREIDRIEPRVSDPIAAIPSSGTISVSGSSRGRGVGPTTGGGGPSGWSQAIGRRCEQYAFEAICELLGDRCVRSEGNESRAVLRLAAGDRIFEWLNAETERYQSWDLQESDAATGEVLRRHEVKARTARLTATEQTLAIGYGDAYLIWRVDPDAGTCVRVKTQDILPEVIAGAKLRFKGAETSSVVVSARASADSGDGPTMIVLGSATRNFCRSLLRRHTGYRGRFRGNLVVVFLVTPELEAVLPPCKSRVWVANRSQAGCALANDAIARIGIKSSSPSSTSLLIVAVQMCTQRGTERALRYASEVCVRESARIAGERR